MNSKDLFCRELPINSAELKIPRTTYQRELNEDRVRRIAAEFDERIALDFFKSAASLGRSSGAAFATAATAVSVGLIAPVRISCLMPGRASSAAQPLRSNFVDMQTPAWQAEPDAPAEEISDRAAV